MKTENELVDSLKVTCDTNGREIIRRLKEFAVFPPSPQKVQNFAKDVIAMLEAV